MTLFLFIDIWWSSKHLKTVSWVQTLWLHPIQRCWLAVTYSLQGWTTLGHPSCWQSKSLHPIWRSLASHWPHWCPLVMQNPSVELHINRFSLINKEPPQPPDVLFHQLKSIMLHKTSRHGGDSKFELLGPWQLENYAIRIPLAKVR